MDSNSQRNAAGLAGRHALVRGVVRFVVMVATDRAGRTLERVALSALLLLATDAGASFGGKLELGFGVMFIGGLIVAIPGGLACLAAEWAGAIRRPPRWVGAVALILGLVALGSVMFVAPDRSAGGLAIFLLPPLMTLALITLLPAPMWRLALVWLVSVGSILLIIAWRMSAGSPGNNNELLGGLLGGALTHMLLWHAGFALAQRRRRIAGYVAPPGPNLMALARTGADGIRAHLPEATAMLRQHSGFWWWAWGTLAFFFAMLAFALVDTTLIQSAIIVSYRLRALFGVEWVNGAAPSFLQMWLTDGVFWSVIAGAGVWGLAATFRRFDPGSLAPLRLAAIVIAASMFLWMAQESSAIRKVNEAEMRASGR